MNTLIRTQTRPIDRWRISLMVMALLVMGAFALRLIELERRPLHFDEGNNVYFALHLPDVLRVSVLTHDTDPPAHRVALSVWMQLAGPSPFSVRLFSVMWGVLAVALCNRLLRVLRLPGSVSGLASAILAVSPYALFYAQEAKSYTMTACFALVSWWAWARMTGPGARPPTNHAERFGAQSARPAWTAGTFPGRGEASPSDLDRHGFGGDAAPLRRTAPWMAAYIASTGLMLGAHYYTAPVLAMQWLWWLGALASTPPTIRAPLRHAVAGAIAQALACLPVAVWIALTLPSLVRGSTALSGAFPRPNLPGLVWQILAEMSAGRAAGPALAAISALLGLLMVVGGLQLYRRGYRAAFWFGISILAPIVGAFVLQQRITFFSPRFLLYALPCAATLIAGCAFTLAAPGRVVRRASLVGIAFLVALAGATGMALYYREPVSTSDDFRPLIRDMRLLVQPGDAALSSYIWLDGIWASYAPDAHVRLRWYDDAYSPDRVEGMMAPVARAHRRVWSFNFMRNPDADETLSVYWLKRHAAYADRFVAGNLAALLFDTQPAPQDERPRSSAVLDRQIRLSFQPGTMTARRGDTLAVTLHWTALHAITEELSIFVQLVGPDGVLIAQNDGDAVNGLSPSFTWQPGQAVVDRRAVLVRQDLPAGNCALIAGLYRRRDGARLISETGQDHVQLATVTDTVVQAGP